jgi:hypothetical protein
VEHFLTKELFLQMIGAHFERICYQKMDNILDFYHIKVVWLTENISEWQGACHRCGFKVQTSPDSPLTRPSHIFEAIKTHICDPSKKNDITLELGLPLEEAKELLQELRCNTKENLDKILTHEQYLKLCNIDPKDCKCGLFGHGKNEFEGFRTHAIIDEMIEI